MGKTTKSKGFYTMINNKVTWITKDQLGMENIIQHLDNVNQDLDHIRLNLGEFSSKELNENREEIYQGLIEVKKTLEKF